MATATVPVTVRIPEATYTALRENAYSTKRTVSAVLIEGIRKVLAASSEQSALTGDAAHAAR